MSQSKSLRIFSLTMALFMLVTSTGFSMDVHYCDGDIKRANVFGKAKTCAEVTACQLKCGKTAKSCSSEKKGCCDNQSYIIDFDFDGAELDRAISTDVQKVLVVDITSTYLAYDAPSSISRTFLYRPPPLINDLQVVYQSFRC